MKPFTTHRKQIMILRSRGLTINGPRALRVLERENYYNVINGYKNLFLIKDKDGKAILPEEYKQGSTFDEIYTLFRFDRELRNILLKYLLMFENDIKSKLAYRFTEKHKEPHAYLQMSSYSKNPKQLKTVLKLIATLSNVISRKAESHGQSPVKHYLDNHGGVPLWVLVNYLTIGNISNFYSVLEGSLQELIAKDFSIGFKKAYHNTYQIPRSTIEDILKTVNLFRNVCAHEERLYCFKLHRPPKSRHISNLLKIPGQYLMGNLFTVVAFLKLTLPKKEHKELVKALSNLFSMFNKKFPSLQFVQVLNVMGFPKDWKSYF